MTTAVSGQDELADLLRSEILAGRLAPGARLRQDAIASTYGVSHIPVREAFRRLEAEGLVAVRPRHGAIVTSLSAGEIEELYEMRIALECCAVRALMRNGSKESIARAESILDEIDREPDRWAELNTAFHIELYRGAHRPRLLATLSSLLRNCERYLRHEVEVLENRDASQRQHRELVKAIKAKNADKACAIIAKHLEETSLG